MWVKGSVARYGCLLRCHALEVNGMHWMWDELLHVVQHLLLSLKWAHALKGRARDSNVKVVTTSVKIDDFNLSIRNCFEHFCLEPFRTDHEQTNASSSLNLSLVLSSY
jgi:hypothetical protein